MDKIDRLMSVDKKTFNKIAKKLIWGIPQYLYTDESGNQFVWPIPYYNHSNKDSVITNKGEYYSDPIGDADLSTQNSLAQGYCMSCDQGMEWGTGKPCRNGCTNTNHKNPTKQGQSAKTLVT